jgi:DNA-binding beta-propeller fold protein YncE
MFTTKRLMGAAMALAMCVLSGVGVADAAAATGDLVQKPGAAGCLSLIGFCERGEALEGARSITVSPDGQNVYVAAADSDAVAVFDRAGDGTLVQKPGQAGCISDTGAGRCRDGTALDGASSVTISPDGNSGYVTSSLSGAVAVFDRTSNGRLVQKPGRGGCVSDGGAGPCIKGRMLNSAQSVAVSPDGLSAYVAGGSGEPEGVAVFDRAEDGTLTQKPGTTGCITNAGGSCVLGRNLGNPQAVTVSPDGKSAYVASSDTGGSGVEVFNRAEDGTLTQKPGLAGCISVTDAFPNPDCVEGTALGRAESVTVSPDGLSAYVAAPDDNGGFGEVSGGAVAMFDRASHGRLIQKPDPVGCISVGGLGPCIDGTGLAGAQSVAVSPDGLSAYVASEQSNALAVFDRAPNGTLAQKPGTAGCIRDTTTSGLQCVDGTALADPESVAVSPDGLSVYVASEASEAVAVFDREATPPPPFETTGVLRSRLAPADRALGP